MAAFVPVTVTGTRAGLRDAKPGGRFAIGHYVVPIDRPTDPPDLVRIIQDDDSLATAETDPVSAVGPPYVDWMNAAANVSVRIHGKSPCSCPACGAWAGLCDCSGELRRTAYAAAALAEAAERDAGRFWNVRPAVRHFVPWMILAMHHNAGGRALATTDPDARRDFAEALRPLFAAGVPADLESAGIRPSAHTDPEGREVKPEAGGIALHHLPWVPLPHPCGEYSGAFTLAGISEGEGGPTDLHRVYFVRRGLGRPDLTGVQPYPTVNSADPAAVLGGLYEDSPFRRLTLPDFVDWVLEFTAEAKKLFQIKDDADGGRS